MLLQRRTFDVYKSRIMFRLLLSSLLLCSFSLTTSYAQSNYVTLLSGHQEVPSTTTNAEGIIEMTLDGDSLEVSGTISSLSSPLDDSQVEVANIYSGYIGQNGPVVLPLRMVQDQNDFSATFIDTSYFVGDIPNFQALLDGGQAYVNVHTLDWAEGEVRGQLVNVTDDRVEDAFDAMMYGDQQNSPVLSDGIGGLLAVVTDDENLIITGSFELDSPLTPAGGTGTHLHIGYHGQNGPIALTLTPTMGATNREGTFEADNNTFSLSNGLDTLVEAIEERRVYVNIHSEDNPSGEVRGQMVAFNNNVYFSYVSYDEPTAFPIAQSVMRIMAEKVMFEESISVSGSYSGWNVNLLAAPLVPYVQFINPFPPATGLTVFPLTEERSTNGSSGIIPLTSHFADANAQIGMMERFRTRAGWATPTGGEFLDSRFYHECKRAFHSSLTGSQAVPSTNSRGTGDIITEYYTNRIESTGLLINLSGPIDANIAEGMNIHDGFAGQIGGPFEGVNFQQSSTFVAIIPAENVKFITTAQARAMRTGGWYYNVNTTNYPSGEVRGQILPRANVMLHGIMSAGQTVPSSGFSLANGAMMGELYADKVAFSGSFNNLDGGFDPNVDDGSQLRGNVPGRTGDVIETLLSGAPVGATDGIFFRENNIFSVSNRMIDSLILRTVYTNINSESVPTGELRGQIGPLATNVTHGILSPDVTVPYTGMQGSSTGDGHLHGEVYGTDLVVSGSWTNLSSAVDSSIGGGAHLHTGTVGEAGGIITPLDILLDSAQTTAILNPVLNQYTLTAGDIDQLLAGDIYANVHTLGAASGAIRGQMLLSENQYPDPSPLFRFPTDGAMIDLGSAGGSSLATIDWVDGAEFDSEQDFGSFWELYADISMNPVFHSQVTDSSGISFTFAQIDALLMDLGIGEGEMATVFHRSATTDGSLIAYSDFSEVTFTRRFTSSVNELPEGSALLVNTLHSTGGELILDINGLEAGQLTVQITGMNGNIIAEQALRHAGSAQRYVLPSTISQTGAYALTLRDEQGRFSSWMFVVQ